MAQLKKSQIAAMEKLGMTEEEIAELAQVDDLIDHDRGEKIHFDFDLTPKQQTVAKEYSIGHTRKCPQSKGEDTETGVEVCYRGDGAGRVRMVMNHNGHEASYGKRRLAPYECYIEAVSP